MKKYLFMVISLFAMATLFACSSDDDDNNALTGFEQYEGTWGPTSYMLDGVEYTCDPNSPGVTNIDRLTFLRNEGQEVIMRIEYYGSGGWRHRRDKMLYWVNGAFHEVSLNGDKVEAGNLYTAITLSGGYLYHTDYPGTKFVKVK